MTKLYHLNDDPNIDEEDFDWIVTDYAKGAWEGSGFAYGFKEGKLYSIDLGHCSCYGPGDRYPWQEVNLQKYLSDNVNYDGKGLELNLKVTELLRGPKMIANLTLNKDQIEDIVEKVLLEKFKSVEELELSYNEDDEEIQLTATVEVQ